MASLDKHFDGVISFLNFSFSSDLYLASYGLAGTSIAWP
jgi:hypothetical protein